MPTTDISPKTGRPDNDRPGRTGRGARTGWALLVFAILVALALAVFAAGRVGFGIIDMGADTQLTPEGRMADGGEGR